MEIYHKLYYKFCRYFYGCYKLQTHSLKKTVKLKYNNLYIKRVYTSGHNAQKYNTKLHNYQFILSSAILPVVLYGCGTLVLTLKEEHRLFERKMLRRIFRANREEKIGH
jgi:archaellum biogenesis protein FlaJ (TadC family)